MINDDALELVKKRANTIFNKLYREKQRLHTKKQKKRQQSNVIIEDLLYKPTFSPSDNQFFKLIENTRRVVALDSNQASGQKTSESLEMIYENSGEPLDSIIDDDKSDEKKDDKNNLTQPLMSVRASSTETSFSLPQLNSKMSGSSLGTQKLSRYQEDFEEIEFLGRGSFSEVVKVRNKLDGRFYAVKKIIIRQGQRLARIMREVQTLSRLHHQNIIRYYQAWLEEVQDSEVKLLNTLISFLLIEH